MVGMARALHQQTPMIRRLLPVLLLGSILAVSSAPAEPLDAPNARALEQAIGSLGSGGGAAIERQDPRLAPIARSPELTQELYDVAGAVLTEIAERNGGDPERMNDALARAKSDPEGFVASLSPATRARVSALAAKLQAH
jgi:hypothetical protein